MKEHTPGPWHWEKSRTMSHLQGNGNFLGISMHHEDEEDRANASLIEAAPDMLAALRAIVDAWLSPLEKRALTVEMCEAARVAIAKAEPKVKA